MVDEMIHVVIDTYYEKKINIILPYYYTLALDIPMRCSCFLIIEMFKTIKY
jgi:hypothetical protein